MVGFIYELWNIVFHMTWNVPRFVSYDMDRNISNISYEPAYENGISNSSNAMAHFMVIRILYTLTGADVRKNHTLLIQPI